MNKTNEKHARACSSLHMRTDIPRVKEKKMPLGTYERERIKALYLLSERTATASSIQKTLAEEGFITTRLACDCYQANNYYINIYNYVYIFIYVYNYI